MKNKKLFAILTLVCFMFTLMPVAAFAATDLYVVEVDNAEDDSITVKTDVPVKVQVKNDEATKYIFWAEDEDGDVELLTDATTEAAISFDTVGTYYVYAVAETATTNLDLNSKTKADAVEMIKDRCDYVDETLEIKVKQADNEYYIVVKDGEGNDVIAKGATKGTINIDSNNGWTEDGELAIYLYDKDDDAVKNEELSFSTNSSYIDVEVDDEYTNRNGKVEIEVTASKSGTYKLYVNHDDADRATITVKVDVGEVEDINTVVEPKGSVALDTSFNGYYGYSGVAFELVSEDGAILDNEDVSLTKDEDYKITLVDAPADSDLDDEDLYLTYDSYTNDAWTLKGNTSFDEEGEYVFKVTLEGGASATATVNVVEFDEPVRMVLTMMDNTVGIDENTANTVEVKAVTYIDANGVTLSSNHTDFDDYGVVEYAANGKAVADIQEDDTDENVKAGTVTIVKDDEDGELIGTTITVYAINDELEMTATATITIVDEVEGLEFADTTADVAVTNKLIVNTVDANGDVVSAGLDNNTELSVRVLDAPANAVYGADAKVTDSDEVTVEFTASATGEYEVQLIVREDGNYYSETATIVVGGTASDFEDIVVVSMGANSMIVNNEVVALDVAPFITNGRTMMQFNVLYVFGIDVEWVAESQSIVAEGEGLKVVMQLGSKVATVNGEEVALDVAPYSVNGRTVVPVGFITGLLDITPTFTYNADGTIADILFAK